VQLFKLSTKQVKGLLEKFASMKPTSSGKVSLDQFLEVLDLPRCYFSEQVLDDLGLSSNMSLLLSEKQQWIGFPLDRLFSPHLTLLESLDYWMALAY
jgi:hypothetical protein